MSKLHRKIGGFLPLELPNRYSSPGVSVWEFWTGSGFQIITSETARGVLRHILCGLSSRRVWFPTFICREYPEALHSIEVRYYPVDERLKPKLDILRDNLKAGDTVVGIDYFGAQAPPAFRQLVKEREDVHWIEDRAQALDPGPAWGDWIIYSPRKLIGVPDGGIGVCQKRDKAIESPVCVKDRDRLMLRLAPLLARLEDTAESDNNKWHTMFQAAEALPERSFGIAMSEFSQLILKAIPVEPLREVRHQNALTLHHSVPPACRLLQTPPQGPWMGYPILLGLNRDSIANALSGRGIFCAAHWRTLPAVVPFDTSAHYLANSILTLPCDQRYTPNEMNQIIDALYDVMNDVPLP